MYEYFFNFEKNYDKIRPPIAFFWPFEKNHNNEIKCKLL
jgi:hypothetical protein